MLDPKVITTIKDLPLLAKTIVDGFMNGFNKSTIKGPGLEFSQYRSYQPGDDLRWMDWRMFARSDRYYIRESEVETSISVKFIIDASASMNHVDGPLTKIDYARYMVASLAYLANQQGDATSLYVLQDGELTSLAARQDAQHLQRIYYQLEQIKPSGVFTQPTHYKELFTGRTQKELLIFITDMYQSQDEISKLIDSLSALKHEVVVFHLMGQNELDFDFKGYDTLEDMETGETIEINAETRKGYQQKLKNHIAEIRIQLLAKNIVYKMLSTAKPLDEALREFLLRRNKGF